MNNTLSKVVIFAVGAVIGSAVTWRLLKTKYERIAQEEIDSVKEAFANRQSQAIVDSTEDICEVETEAVQEEPTNTIQNEYEDMIGKLSYTTYSTKKESETISMENKPYVISPEQYEDNDEYDNVSLDYYADGVLTDDWGNVIEDVESMVGLDFPNCFGKYDTDEDTVFVRNDAQRIDYEILRDSRKWSDIPHQLTEDE